MAFEDQIKDALVALMKKPDTLPAEFKSWLVKTAVAEGGSLKSLGVTLTAIDWPIGFPLWSVSAAIPTGMFEFDGSVFAQATYPIMFGLYSTSWNTGGEGAGNFRIPDLRERAPFGKGTKPEVNTVGKTDGAAIGARGPVHATSIGTLATTNGTSLAKQGAGTDGLTSSPTIPIAGFVNVGLTGTPGGSGPVDSPGYATGIWIGNPG